MNYSLTFKHKHQTAGSIGEYSIDRQVVVHVPSHNAVDLHLEL